MWRVGMMRVMRVVGVVRVVAVRRMGVVPVRERETIIREGARREMDGPLAGSSRRIDLRMMGVMRMVMMGFVWVMGMVPTA